MLQLDWVLVSLPSLETSNSWYFLDFSYSILSKSSWTMFIVINVLCLTSACSSFSKFVMLCYPPKFDALIYLICQYRSTILAYYESLLFECPMFRFSFPISLSTIKSRTYIIFPNSIITTQLGSSLPLNGASNMDIGYIVPSHWILCVKKEKPTKAIW